MPIYESANAPMAGLLRHQHIGIINSCRKKSYLIKNEKRSTFFNATPVPLATA